MRKRPLLLLLLLASLIVSPVDAKGGFEVPDQGAAAGGAGGTGTARHGDPSSAWYNPAELADGRGFRGGLGLLLAIPSIGATGLEDPMATARTVESVSPPPHLHLSYSDDVWAIGMYVGLSHGSSVQWPEGWWGRFESLQTGILGIRAAPFFSLRLGGEHGLIEGFPDLRVSLGLHVDSVRLESQRALDFIDQEGRVHLLLSGAGVGGDASLYYQATDELAFGFTYKSRTFVGLNGDADFTVPDAFVGRAPDQHASAELIIPDRISLGAAYQTPEFGIFLDLGFTLWSVRDRTVVNFEADVTNDIDTPQRWHDAFNLRVGGEVSPIDLLHLRAGFVYDMEVGPDDTLAPSSPDMARVGVTLGVGVDIAEGFGADFYYGYLGFLDRTSTGPDAALAHYFGDLHLVGLTVRVVLDTAPAQSNSEAPVEDGDETEDESIDPPEEDAVVEPLDDEVDGGVDDTVDDGNGDRLDPPEDSGDEDTGDVDDATLGTALSSALRM